MKRSHHPSMLFLLCIFYLVFGIYITTLYPTSAPEDSGMYIPACTTLGIPHPPGNPLYILVGKVFSTILFFSEAYTINLVSSFSAALTSCVVFKLMLLLQPYKIIAFITSLVFAFSYIPWYTSTFAKHFSLINFFFSLIIFFTLLWYKQKSLKYLYLVSFLLGLGLGVHYFLACFFIPLIFMVFVMKSYKIQNIVIAFCMFLLGLSSYLYVPIRFSVNPILVNIPEPDKMHIMDYFLRKDYSAIFRISPVATAVGSLKECFQRLEWLFLASFDHFLVIWVLLAFVGFYLLLKMDKSTFFYLFLLWFITGPLFILFIAFPLDGGPYYEAMNERFLGPFDLILVICGGVAVSKIMDYCSKKSLNISIRILLLCYVFGMIFYHYPAVTKRYNFLFYDWGNNIFRTMRPNSIYFASQHTNAVTMYLQIAKDKRKDLKCIASPEIFHSLLNNATILRSCQLYSDVDFKDLNVNFTPYGLLFRISTQPFLFNKDFCENFYIYRGVRAGKYKEFYSEVIVMQYAEAHHRLGRYFLNINDLINAEKEFKKSINIGLWGPEANKFRTYKRISPSSLWPYIGLGEVWYKQKQYEKSERLYHDIIKSYPEIDLPGVYLSLASIYSETGRNSEAVRVMEDYTLKHPENLLMLQNLGIFYEKAGDFEKAIETYSRLIQLDVNNPRNYYLLSVVYWKLSNWREVVKNLNQCLKLFRPSEDTFMRKEEIERLLQIAQERIREK